MFKFPWAVRGERNVWERAGTQEVKWVQEEKADHSAQGQGHLEKNVWNVLFVFLYALGSHIPTKSI